MKYLVTGGLGAVGVPLVTELGSRGHEVWVCDLAHYHDQHYIRCDVASFNQLLAVFKKEQFDVVFHLAAEFGRWNGEDFYDTLWRTNAVGTKNILRLQEQYRFRHIFFSSSEVYGDYEGVMSEEVLDEHEIKQLNDYAMTKWVGEQQVLNSASQFETETVRVRLFNTYGPGEYYSPYRSVICRFVYSALNDLPYTVYMGHHRSSTYIADTVRTLANIPENFKAGEVYNIGGEEYHDIKEVSDIILRETGRTETLVTYKDLEPFTTKDKKIDISKAKRDLSHVTKVNLTQGIPLTVEWMKSVYQKG